MQNTNTAILNPVALIGSLDEALSKASGREGKPRRGRRASVSLGTLLFSTIRQKICRRGAMSEHVKMASARSLEGSTVSRRLAKVSKEQLEAVGGCLLGPIGDRSSNAGGYYRDYRTVGIDGTCFTLINSEAIIEKVPKSKSGRSMYEESVEVAFPQINASSLVELGPHNPLALSVGIEGESEMELSIGLLKELSKADMLLGDRLYGVGWFLHQVVEQDRCGAFLLKVSNSQTSRGIEELEDGSWIVEVDVRSRRRPADIIASHRVREIRYEIDSTDEQGQPRKETYRLWTNLMDCRIDPATVLIDLYQQRWEHEGYYRELKLELKKQKHLNAQLPETALIEILSMVWASALIAKERQRLATLNGPTETSRRVRFDVVQENIRVLWPLQRQVGVHLSQAQFEAIVQSLSEEASLYYTPEKRKRSCPRKVRQNQKHWPKIRERTESNQPVRITVIDRK